MILSLLAFTDKDFHHMMSANDLTYSTLFCDKVFGSAFGSHVSLESCNVMGEYARHGERPLVTSIQSAREKGIPYYESSSEEEDEDDELYMGRSMYSNTGHFRNIAFNTNSVTDLIHCMDGYESFFRRFLIVTVSIFWQMKEESWDASCQSFPNGSQGVVGSEKSTLSNHAILGSGKTFGDKIDALYVLENNLALIESVTGMKSGSLAPKGSVTGMANQGELDEVKSLSTPTTQGVLKNTPEGSRLSKFKLVDELYNESIMSNFDDVDLYNNIWSVLTDRLMFSKQDDDVVKNKAKLVYDNNQLKIQNAKKRYFDAYNSNVPLDVGRDQSREMLPKYQDDKFNAANSNRPSVNDKQYTEDRYENVQVELSSKFNPNQHVCATYLWSEEGTEKPLILDACDDNYNKNVVQGR